MNAKEAGEWVKAVGACVAGADAREAAAAVKAFGTEGSWQASVCGRGPGFVGLRFFGAGSYAPWRAACAKLFSPGSGGPSAPREGHPWLSAAWDLSTGRRTALRLCGEAAGVRLKPGQAFAWDYPADGGAPTRRLLSPAPFKTGHFGEPALDRVLADFSGLSPLRALTVEEQGWSLSLAEPPRWPMFARSDVSAAFTPHSSQFALFMLDRRVAEIAFDGEALWAHCAG